MSRRRSGSLPRGRFTWKPARRRATSAKPPRNSFSTGCANACGYSSSMTWRSEQKCSSLSKTRKSFGKTRSRRRTPTSQRRPPSIGWGASQTRRFAVALPGLLRLLPPAIVAAPKFFVGVGEGRVQLDRLLETANGVEAGEDVIVRGHGDELAA